MPKNAKAERLFAQAFAAPPAVVVVRQKRGTITVKRRAKGTRERVAVPRQLHLTCTQAVIRDFAAHVAALGAPPSTCLLAFILAVNANHETGHVDPRFTGQEHIAKSWPISVASVRRGEDWLAKRGLLLRERVQITRRKRTRVLACVLRKRAIPTAHGERRSTAHGERLGVERKGVPQTPAQPTRTTPRVSAELRPASEPQGAPPLPRHPPIPDSPSAPVGKDERRFAPRTTPDPEPNQGERGFAASATPDSNPEGVTHALRGGYRAGDAIPRAPRSDRASERSPEALMGPDDGSSPDPRLAAARSWLVSKPAKPARHDRAAPGRAVDAEAFARLEALAGVTRAG